MGSYGGIALYERGGPVEAESGHIEEESGHRRGTTEQWRNQDRVRRAERENKTSITPQGECERGGIKADRRNQVTEDEEGYKKKNWVTHALGQP